MSVQTQLNESKDIARLYSRRNRFLRPCAFVVLYFKKRNLEVIQSALSREGDEIHIAVGYINACHIRPISYRIAAVAEISIIYPTPKTSPHPLNLAM